MKKEYLRVGEVSKLLSVTPQTVRKWRDEGKLKGYKTPGGQTLYKTEEIESYLSSMGNIPEIRAVHYARSSMGKKEAIESQFKKLREQCGEPDYEIKDKGSGLNENRKGLNRILDLAEKGRINCIRVTEPDRLTRFGRRYLERYLKNLGVKVEYVFEGSEKTPEEELRQDFMSLIASFSGKFYRLRGYKEQRKLLRTSQEEIERRERKRLEENAVHNGDKDPEEE